MKPPATHASLLLALLLSACAGAPAAPPSPADGRDWAAPARERAAAAAERHPEARAFFDSTRPHSMVLRVERADWDRLNADMAAHKDAFGNMGVNRLYPADLEVVTAAGPVSIPRIGFRTRGNTTRVQPEPATGRFQRAHFQFDFDETFALEPGTEEYEETKRRSLFGLTALALKYSDDERGALREWFALRFLGSSGVDAPRAALGLLRVEIAESDGRRTSVDFGAYTLIEQVNRAFLKARWPGASSGELYKCLWQQGGPATLAPLGGAVEGGPLLGRRDWTRDYRPSYELEAAGKGSPADHGSLRAFTEDLDRLEGAELEAWLEANFEIGPFIRALAACILLGNPDDYRAMGNNYYLYFPPEGGRAAFIPYDFDHVLGFGWHPFPTETTGLFAVPDLCGRLSRASGPLPRPLADKVLAIPRYRSAYLAAVRELLGGPFSYKEYLKEYSLAKGGLDDHDLFGPDGELRSLPEDPGASVYFSERTNSAMAELARLEGKTAKAEPALSILRLEGFTDEGGGAWGVRRAAGGVDPAVKVGAVLEGVRSSRVVFTLRFAPSDDKLDVVLPAVEDAKAPYEAVFALPLAQGAYRLRVEAFDARGRSVLAREEGALARCFYGDYASVEARDGGSRLFRFRPTHEAYAGARMKPLAGRIFLRGALDANGGDWARAIRMEGPDDEGFFTVFAEASPGQSYKFFYDLYGTYDPERNPYSGFWTADLHNPHGGSGRDCTSFVP